MEAFYPVSDLELALVLFQESPDVPCIVLVVSKRAMIPYIRRSVMRFMGVPSKMVNDSIWYDRREIRIYTEREWHKWCSEPEEKVFKIETWEV